MANKDKTIMWRKHPFILLSGISIPTMQFLLILFFTIGIQSLYPPSYATIGDTNLQRLPIAVDGIWTILHLSARFRSKPVVKEELATLTRRKALLDRVISPWRSLIIISGLMLVAFCFILAIFSPLLSIIVYCGFLILWFVAETVDWWNDRYILTEDRILDIVRFPVLYTQRTEAPLRQVQNVMAETTFVGGIVGYGNVEVETAGKTRVIVFENVPNPHSIVPMIFDRIDELREREQERQREEQAEELLRWFDVYHDLTSKPLKR